MYRYMCTHTYMHINVYICGYICTHVYIGTHIAYHTHICIHTTSHYEYLTKVLLWRKRWFLVINSRLPNFGLQL